MGLATCAFLATWIAPLVLPGPLGLGQAGTPPAQDAGRLDTPGKVISLAFKHYYDAKSAAGQVRLTQSARGVSVVIDTSVAFDRPIRLYLEQSEPSQGKHWLSISDGKVFAYDKPASTLGRDRLQEYVQQGSRAQTVTMMYDASGKSIGDRSPALDIIFAGTDDLKALRMHWAGIHLSGKSQVRGKDVNVVEGDYCQLVGQEPTGYFEMDITDEGDLLRYVLKNRYAVPGQPGQTVEVTSVWDVDVKVGATVDPKVFQVKG